MPASTPKRKFRRGALALIDALGFKGIWGNNPKRPNLAALETLEAVRAALESATEEARATLRQLPGGFKHVRPDVSLHVFSDTFAIGASLPEHRMSPKPERRPPSAKDADRTMTEREWRNALDDMMRLVVCDAVTKVLRTAALAPYPLAFRGVVCVGEFLFAPPLWVGPAVDEAAELYELADGAFVWWAPSAARVKRAFIVPRRATRRFREWAVPLRDGRTVPTTCVCPSGGCETLEEAREIRSAIVRTMPAQRLDVTIKRRNTLQFFNVLKREEEALAADKAEAAALRSERDPSE